jgi:hypothetical protein
MLIVVVLPAPWWSASSDYAAPREINRAPRVSERTRAEIAAPKARRSLSQQIRYLIEFKSSGVPLRLPATRRMNYLESRNTTVKE